MKLSTLLNGIPLKAPLAQDAEVQSLTLNSKTAGPGAAFFAFRGAHHDGNRFVEEAYGQGCRVVVSETAHSIPGMVSVSVPDAREALALAAANFYGRPSEKLLLVGITGTNGKTTTSYLVDSLLKGPQGKSTVLGTLQYLVHGRTLPSDHTTPEAHEIANLLSRALEAGAVHAVMEVSSHALALKRVHGMVFRVAVFTNLTRDHMDFHESEADYAEAKIALFERLLASDGWAVVNADDPKGDLFARRARGRVLRYGRGRGIADIYPLSVTPEGRLTRIDLASPSGEISFLTGLKGGFNLYNLMAAAGAGVAAGRHPSEIADGIARVPGVPGRFEAVDRGQPFLVLVDYAHTPDALHNVLKSAREITAHKLLCVFGCGGDRDRGKRPQMGRVAEALADFLYITSDNPRTEPPQGILDDILAGIADRRKAAVIENRGAAIEAALEAARAGDTVVVAGKGHEDYQIIGTVKHPFDDRQVAAKILEAQNYGTAVGKN